MQEEGFRASNAPGLIKVMWYAWLLDFGGLFLSTGWAIAWTCLNLRNFGASASLILFVLLIMIAGFIRRAIEHFRVANIIIEDAGVKKMRDGKVALSKWEDLAQCRQHNRNLYLAFSSGQKFKIPWDVRGFENIKAFCVENLKKFEK